MLCWGFLSSINKCQSNPEQRNGSFIKLGFIIEEKVDFRFLKAIKLLSSISQKTELFCVPELLKTDFFSIKILKIMTKSKFQD